MAHSEWILPRAEAGCNKVFHPDRQSAEGHRIALELWIQATGKAQPGFRIVTFHCRNCGGYHVSRRRVKKGNDADLSRLLAAHSFNPWDEPESTGLVPDGSPLADPTDGSLPWL